jgi:Cu/Ag efflux protein CusF
MKNLLREFDRMLKKTFATVAVLILGMGLAAGQKEAKDAIHLNGTVTKIDGNTVTVSVGEQKADVVLEPGTTYKVGVKPAARGDVQMGDTVSVTVVRHNPEWQAVSVRITHPKPAK